MSFKDLEQTAVGLTISVMGQDVAYKPIGDSAVTIKGIFDNAYVETEGIVSLKPTLRINLSDLSSAPRKGDSVVITTISYRVLESRADGYGGSTLILQKV